MLTSRRDSGFATPEHLLATAATFAVLLLAVQLALCYLAHRALQAAVDDGVRAARAETGTAGSGRDTTLRRLDQIAPRLLVGPRVTATRTATTARVAATSRVVSLLPGFGVHLTVHATSPIERVS